MSYNGKHPAQIAQELEPVLARVVDRSQLRVLSASLNIGGEPISLAYRHGVGRLPDAEQPLFPVGCVMDTIFSIIGVHLHHHAGLKLDEPIRNLIPEIFPDDADDGLPPITFQHLLTRTSGIQDPRSIEEMRTHIPWPDLAPRIREAPRLFSPGSAFNVGGIDRTLLAAALLKFTKMSFGQLTEEIINIPCGVEVRPEQYTPVGEDGVRRVAHIDTGHMARVAACLAAGSLDGVNVAFSEPVRTYLQVEKLSISRSVKSPPWPHTASAFTLGFYKFSDNLIGYNGFDQGVSCSVRYDPQSNLGFSVALEGPPGVRDYIVAQIAQRLGFNCAQSRAMPCTVGSLNGLSPADIEGEYAGWAGGFEARVRLDGPARVIADMSYRDHHYRIVKVRLEDNSWLVADTAADISSLEFYRDRGTGRVCMASGGTPFAMTGIRLDA